VSGSLSKCFYLSGKVVASSWSDARNRCTRLRAGAELASLEDQYQLNTVLGSPDLLTPCFIGATDKEREGSWKWIDGSPWTWGGEENKGNKEQNCLEMTVITNKQGLNMTAWSGVDCEKVLPRSFICSFKKGVKKYPREIFSIEIPLIERNSKKFKGGERSNLLTGQPIKGLGMEAFKDRTFDLQDVDIFDRSKVDSSCIAKFERCSKNHPNSSEHNDCLKDFTDCSQSQVLLPDLYQQLGPK